jgi:hypothetical protein
MRRLALVVLLVALAASEAPAAPPAGFAEFPWGTAPGVVREQLLVRRCRDITDSTRVWYSLQCRDYDVEGVSVAILRLDFEPANSLAGYYMLIARGSYRRFRDLFVQRFGAPTARQSFPWQPSVLSWTSPTVTATLFENCGAELSCIEVRTVPLDRKRQQTIEREQRDAAQSF